jgi:leader peptidase (prepilin peptidase) / N-methyltransferase
MPAAPTILSMEASVPQITILALFGAAFGSFVNVLAYRLPRGESIVRPGSHCPGCGVQIHVYDNVPVVSWLALGGRCRSCGGAISARYPIVEALTASLFAAVGLQTDMSPELWPGLALMVTLVTVSATDIEHRIVPNKVVATAALAALALWGLVDPSRLPENLIAAASAGGFLLLAAIAYPAGMGMGDVKLAGVMGLFLGRSVAPAMLTAFGLGTLIGIAIMLARGSAARKQAIPFAPFMALGGIVGQLFGDDIVDWYVGTFL